MLDRNILRCHAGPRFDVTTAEWNYSLNGEGAGTPGNQARGPDMTVDKKARIGLPEWMRRLSDAIARCSIAFSRSRHEPAHAIRAGKFFTRDLLQAWAEKRGFRGLEVGDHSYGNPSVMWWGEDAKLKIGKFCSIADNVSLFLGGNHRADWVTTYPFSGLAPLWPEAAGIKGHPATNGDVVVGNDVWLASGCTILSGITVGDGAVIGARAVVTKDVPPYAIVAGNPAEIVRFRFDPQTIERLLRIRWWDWPESRIHAAMPMLLSPDIGAFLDVAERAGPAKPR